MMSTQSWSFRKKVNAERLSRPLLGVRKTVRKLFRVYLEKPELAGIALLVLLTAIFEIRSDGVFLSAENLRAMLGLLPEVGLVSIGVTVLMIPRQFDLSLASMLALIPLSVAPLTNPPTPF